MNSFSQTGAKVLVHRSCEAMTRRYCMNPISKNTAADCPRKAFSDQSPKAITIGGQHAAKEENFACLLKAISLDLDCI
jgi:hypothetical protein